MYTNVETIIIIIIGFNIILKKSIQGCQLLLMCIVDVIINPLYYHIRAWDLMYLAIFALKDKSPIDE